MLSRMNGAVFCIVVSPLCSAVTGRQQAFNKYLLDAKMNHLTASSLMLEKVYIPHNNLYKGKFQTKLTATIGQVLGNT